MARTEYLNTLSPEDRLRVRIEVERGQVTDFTIQYETAVESEYLPVVRYDLAHGYAHRDILDVAGLIVAKDSMPEHWSIRQCLDYAITDTRRHWRTYRRGFRRETDD